MIPPPRRRSSPGRNSLGAGRLARARAPGRRGAPGSSGDSGSVLSATLSRSVSSSMIRAATGCPSSMTTTGPAGARRQGRSRRPGALPGDGLYSDDWKKQPRERATVRFLASRRNQPPKNRLRILAVRLPRSRRSSKGDVGPAPGWNEFARGLRGPRSPRALDNRCWRQHHRFMRMTVTLDLDVAERIEQEVPPQVRIAPANRARLPKGESPCAGLTSSRFSRFRR